MQCVFQTGLLLWCQCQMVASPLEKNETEKGRDQRDGFKFQIGPLGKASLRRGYWTKDLRR